MIFICWKILIARTPGYISYAVVEKIAAQRMVEYAVIEIATDKENPRGTQPPHDIDHSIC